MKETAKRVSIEVSDYMIWNALRGINGTIKISKDYTWDLVRFRKTNDEVKNLGYTYLEKEFILVPYLEDDYSKNGEYIIDPLYEYVLEKVNEIVATSDKNNLHFIVDIKDAKFESFGDNKCKCTGYVHVSIL